MLLEHPMQPCELPQLVGEGRPCRPHRPCPSRERGCLGLRVGHEAGTARIGERPHRVGQLVAEDLCVARRSAERVEADELGVRAARHPVDRAEVEQNDRLVRAVGSRGRDLEAARDEGVPRGEELDPHVVGARVDHLEQPVERRVEPLAVPVHGLDHCNDRIPGLELAAGEPLRPDRPFSQGCTCEHQSR